MSPQPAAAPPAQNAQAPHAALLKRINDTPEGDRSSAEKQIFRANLLERQRGDLMKKIAANRDYLRLMADNEELGDPELDWLEDFYPSKERGATRTEDEVERTRKVKAAARGTS